MDWLRKRNIRNDLPTVIDPVFGELEYDSAGFWIRQSSPLQNSLMVIVIAPATGPSEGQRIFFSEIQQSLISLSDAASAFVIEQNVQFSQDALRVYAIEIGNELETTNRQFTMELVDQDEIVVHRVTMVRGKPTVYTIDD